jgi:cytoskeletal protein CcmA (bactofilin family)
MLNLKKFSVLLTASLLLLLFAIPTVALAEEIEEDEVVHGDITLFDEDLEIKEGGVVNGDVVIFSGDMELAGTVNGDVVLFDGDLELDGEVNGDIVLMSGNVDAASSATVSGDCLLFSGNLRGDAALSCTITTGDDFLNEIFGQMDAGGGFVPAEPPVPPVPPVPPIPGGSDADMTEWHHDDFDHGRDWDKYDHYDREPGFIGRLLGILSSSVLLGGLAFMATLLAPTNLTRIQDAAQNKTGVSAGVGFLTGIAVPSIMAILTVISAILLIICIGIVGFPLLFVIGMALGLAYLLGWIAVGTLWGEKLAGWFKWYKLSPQVTAMMGTFALTLGVGLLGLIPLVPESLISAVIAFIGLGAVALTQFGTKPYPRPTSGRAVDDPDVDQDKVDIVLNTLPDED